ncbi:MAG: SpoVA/SpoVAEb family sporulation membrane protein [Lachnospiraceae bacterium]|nr:SpoVA/SpoVAEb family sporulation membrane protein [Lachnospiraceae bacterium]
MQIRDDKELSKKYNQYVKKVTKTTSLIKNMINAFLVGGAICSLGQIITNILQRYGVGKENASYVTIIILVGLSALLTGLNIYPKIGKYGGAGSLVPITGFANSVAAAAIEFKAEGMVMGLGCKIFTIAGPVILYGILSSWVLGIIYFLFQ